MGVLLLRDAEVVEVCVEARLAVQTERGNTPPDGRIGAFTSVPIDVRRGVRPRDSLPRAVLVGAQLSVMATRPLESVLLQWAFPAVLWMGVAHTS